MSNDQLQPVKEQNQKLTAWERERNKLKTLRVVVVLMFWFTSAFQVALYYWEDGRLNFILLSIIGGMMVLGIALKIRYQRHLNTKK